MDATSDLMFIGVSTPSSPLSQHGHKLLLITPVIEGLLGGWTTLQSATSAYISDCTSPGSRAQIFSRFSGAFYIGFCIGPSIGGYLIQHPFSFMGHLGVSGPKSVTCVFWTAIVFSFTNFILVLFVFPESTTKEKRAKALGAHLGPGKGKARVSADDASGNDNADDSEGTESGVIARFLKPLAVFLPVVVMDPSGFGRKKKDWNLTILAVAALSIHLAGVSHMVPHLNSATEPFVLLREYTRSNTYMPHMCTDGELSASAIISHGLVAYGRYSYCLSYQVRFNLIGVNPFLRGS